MQCAEFQSVWPDIQLRNVEPAKETEARSHASACQSCGAFLASERDLDAVIAAAAQTIVPPSGAAGRIWRAMGGGPPPVTRWLATAAAVLLLATAAALPFLLGGTASADDLLAHAVELHRATVAAPPADCCGDLAQLGTTLPADPTRDRLLPLAARHGWRFAAAARDSSHAGGVRLTFRKRTLWLSCLMLPDPGYVLGDPQHANGHTYWTYESAGLHHVVQRLPGERLCVLTADTDAETLADLVLSADADTPAPAEAAAGIPLTWRVGNVHCDRCGGVIRATLETVDGIVRAEVAPEPLGDGTERRVRVWLALRITDRAPLLDAAHAALDDAGFPLLEAR